MTQRIRTSPLKSNRVATRTQNTNRIGKTISQGSHLNISQSQTEINGKNATSLIAAQKSLNNSTINGTGLKSTTISDRLMVHDGELYSELLQDIDPNREENDLFPSEPHLGTKKMKQQDLIAQAKARNEQRTREKWEQMGKNAQRSVEKLRAKREENFKKQFSDLMEERETFLSRIDKTLHLSDEAYMYNLAKTHEQWTKDIFDPIQKTISEQIERNGDETWILRNQCYEKFLQADKKRVGGVKRDVLDSEYNPLEAHQSTIKYKTNRSKDPTKRSHLKTDIEKIWRNQYNDNQDIENQLTTKSSSTNKDISNSNNKREGVREMFQITDYGRAESTPSGHYSHQNPTVYAKPNDYFKSKIPLDHYKEPDYERSLQYVKQEQGPGKKIFGEKKEYRQTSDFVNGDKDSSPARGKRTGVYKLAEPSIVLG